MPHHLRRANSLLCTRAAGRSRGPGHRHEPANGVASRERGRAVRRGGFTLVELMIVIVIIGTLSIITVPAAKRYIENTRVARAMLDVRLLEKEIMAYRAAQGVLPPDLAAIGRGGFLDPWETAYAYLPIAGYNPAKGKLRKDHFLVPINGDFDLYSLGEDGQSAAPLNAAQGKDDIVRANNGSYVGLGENF